MDGHGLYVTDTKKTEKQSFRTRVRAMRDTLAPQTAQLWSKKICQRILKWDCYVHAKQLFAYYPSGSEADIRPVLKEALESGKQVGLPRVEGRQKMSFYQIQGFGDLNAGTMGLMEPSQHCLKLMPLPGDGTGSLPALMLVPGLAFGAEASGISRMGYGGGFYDTWLAAFEQSGAFGPLLTCGVTFDCLLFGAAVLPVEPHDRLLYAAVTESRRLQPGCPGL